MVEFTTNSNGKEIVFTETGIRYDGKVFIKYEDMEDITQRKGSDSAIVFRYKGHLVKMAYDAADEEEVSKYIAEATYKPEPEPEPEVLPTDKFNYLDAKPEDQEEKEPKKKKGKKGLIIAGFLVVAVVVMALVFLL